jgi:hypothetical protein
MPTLASSTAGIIPLTGPNRRCQAILAIVPQKVSQFTPTPAESQTAGVFG